ncbi:MAG: recombinase family protein [Bacteroidota bacterium]
MKVKYLRVSTAEQNTARQEVNANTFDKVYIDRCSGSLKLAERKEGKKLLKDIESGQATELHIASIDRLGRNLIDVLTMVELFNKHQVNVFIENIGMFSLIDKKPNGSFKMIISVLGNVAELEREYLLERQKQGIEIAKAKGVYTGRLYGTKMTDSQLLDKYKTVVAELKKGESLRRAAKLGSCSLGTAQRIKGVLENHKQEMQPKAPTV